MKTKTTHTPQFDSVSVVSGGFGMTGDTFSATVNIHGRHAQSKQLENLIAAAPDMLAALQMVSNQMMALSENARNAVIAAIAKAEGE